MLEALGWIVIRVIAEDKPQDVIARASYGAAIPRLELDLEAASSKRNELQGFTRTFAYNVDD